MCEKHKWQRTNQVAVSVAEANKEETALNLALVALVHAEHDPRIAPLISKLAVSGGYESVTMVTDFICQNDLTNDAHSVTIIAKYIAEQGFKNEALKVTYYYS